MLCVLCVLFVCVQGGSLVVVCCAVCVVCRSLFVFVVCLLFVV